MRLGAADRTLFSADGFHSGQEVAFCPGFVDYGGARCRFIVHFYMSFSTTRFRPNSKIIANEGASCYANNGHSFRVADDTGPVVGTLASRA